MIRDGFTIHPDDEWLVAHPFNGAGGTEYIGHGHWLRRQVWQGEPSGVLDIHMKADGRLCFGGARWAGPDDGHAKWKLVSVEPLHIEPSLACRGCGDHGWIRDGKWVPA